MAAFGNYVDVPSLPATAALGRKQTPCVSAAFYINGRNADLRCTLNKGLHCKDKTAVRCESEQRIACGSAVIETQFCCNVDESTFYMGNVGLNRSWRSRYKFHVAIGDGERFAACEQYGPVFHVCKVKYCV